MTSPVTAIVADDQPLFRAGLAGALRTDSNLTLLAETGDGHDALSLLIELRPQVAAVALELPALDGLGLLDAVRREELPTRVLLLSASFGDRDVRDALGSGAAGLLSKRAEATEVRAALLAIARGEQVLDPRVAAGEGGRFTRDDGTRPLTAREREVLQLMAEGMSGPQIARELIVSPSTIKSHTENLYAKLGVCHRGAAVAEGMRRGLLR